MTEVETKWSVSLQEREQASSFVQKVMKQEERNSWVALWYYTRIYCFNIAYLSFCTRRETLFQISADNMIIKIYYFRQGRAGVCGSLRGGGMVQPYNILLVRIGIV